MRRSPHSPPIPPDSAVASQSHLHTRDSFLFSTKTPQNAAPTTAWSNPSSPRGSWQVLGVAPTIPVQLILCRFPIRESIPRCGKFSSSFFRREKAAPFFFTMGNYPQTRSSTKRLSQKRMSIQSRMPSTRHMPPRVQNGTRR